MVTIKQIAERAGVSTTTVSNVIHGNIKRVSPDNVEKIKKLIVEMGYVERIGFHVLRNTNSKLIAVIIQKEDEQNESLLSDPFFGTITGAIERSLQRAGYYMIFYSSSNINDIFHMAMSCDVDGIIALSFSRKNCEKLQHCIQKPIISIDAYGNAPEGYNVPDIGLDDRNAGNLIGGHLYELGYEDIFFCSSGQQVQYRDTDVESSRLFGIQEAWEKLPGNGTANRPRPLNIGTTEQARHSAYQEIIRHVPFKRKTAYVFNSDYHALDALSYLTERGIKVPDDIGIAGFDDILFASKYNIIPLTTVHQDIKRKGSLAVQELLNMIKDENYVPKSYRLTTTLMKRRSV